MKDGPGGTLRVSQVAILQRLRSSLRAPSAVATVPERLPCELRGKALLEEE